MECMELVRYRWYGGTCTKYTVATMDTISVYYGDVFDNLLFVTILYILWMWLFDCKMRGVEAMELKLEHISKNYGEKRALDDVSIVLEPGIYGLLGPNGAGKSTMIKLLTDNLKRQDGSILWNGTDILQLGKKYRELLDICHSNKGIMGICQ